MSNAQQERAVGVGTGEKDNVPLSSQGFTWCVYARK